MTSGHAKLAPSYTHPARRRDRGEGEGGGDDLRLWRVVERDGVGRKNPDATTSCITIIPGFNGLEFVVGENTLTLRDTQHEYVYQGLALPAAAATR